MKIVSMYHWKLNKLQEFEDHLDAKAGSAQWTPSTIQSIWYDKLTRQRIHAQHRADAVVEELQKRNWCVTWQGEVVHRDDLQLQAAGVALGN